MSRALLAATFTDEVSTPHLLKYVRSNARSSKKIKRTVYNQKKKKKMKR